MSNIVFELFAKLGLDSSDYEKGLDNAKSKATTAGSLIGNGLKTIGKVGAAALGAATTAVGAFATSSVKTGAEFDKSMSQVAATMGFTVTQLNATEEQLASMTEEERNAAIAAQESFGQLREYAQEMGRTTAFSASQASDALNYMALAGYDVETSMAMLPNVLNLAASGNMELARASDMVTDAATAFGLVLEDGSVDIERTTQMVDEMAKAASTGNTNVEQLGDAFLVVGGLAKEMNGGMVQLSDGTTATYDNVQELEIALTAMANAGIKGSEAGTHMRNMLLKLASPTEDGYKAFTALGVSVFDSEGKMRSLAGIMEDLDGAMANLTQEEKLQAISDIFNTRDVAAAEALMSAVNQDWDSIAESILDAEGAAGEMAKTQLDNLAGDVTLWQSALEGAKIAISDGLTPSIREFVQFGTDGLSRLTSAFKEGGISGAMAEFGTILSEGIAMVTQMLPDAVNSGMELLGAVGQGILQNLPVIIDAAVDIVEQLANGFVTALPALADGALQIIVGLADGIARMLPTLIPTIVDVVMQIVDTLIDNVPLLVDGAVQLILGLAEGLINAIPVLTERLPEIITSIVEALVESIPLLVDGAIQLIQGIIDALPTIIEALITAIPQLIDAYVNGLITYLPVLIDGVIQLVVALAQAMPQIIEALVAAIPTIVQTITEALITNLPILIDGVIQITTAMVNAIIENLPLFLSAGLEILVTLVDAFITNLPLIIEAVLQIVATIITTIVEKLPEILEKGKEILTNLIEGILSMLADIGKAAATIIEKFMGGIRERFSRLVSIGKEIIGNVKDGIQQKIEDAKNWGKDLISNFISGLKEKWENLKGAVSDIAGSIKDLLGFSEPKEGPLSNFHTYAPDMMQLFAQGVRDNEDMLKSVVADAFNFSDVIVGASPRLAYAGADGGYNQTINIYSPTALTPSEVARQTRNATRDMVLELRGKR